MKIERIGMVSQVTSALSNSTVTIADEEDPQRIFEHMIHDRPLLRNEEFFKVGHRVKITVERIED